MLLRIYEILWYNNCNLLDQIWVWQVAMVDVNMFWTIFLKNKTKKKNKKKKTHKQKQKQKSGMIHCLHIDYKNISCAHNLVLSPSTYNTLETFTYQLTKSEIVIHFVVFEYDRLINKNSLVHEMTNVTIVTQIMSFLVNLENNWLGIIKHLVWC